MNDSALEKAFTLQQYAGKHVLSNISLDYDIRDKKSRFTYSEVLSFIELYTSKKTEIEIIRSGLVRVAPTEKEATEADTPTGKTYKTTLPERRTTVAKYRNWLQNELQKLAGVSNDDYIDFG